MMAEHHDRHCFQLAYVSHKGWVAGPPLAISNMHILLAASFHVHSE